MVTGWLYWLGDATLAFLAAIDHLGIRVALGRAESLGPAFRVLVIVYLVCTLTWSIVLMVRFTRRPQPD